MIIHARIHMDKKPNIRRSGLRCAASANSARPSCDMGRLGGRRSSLFRRSRPSPERLPCPCSAVTSLDLCAAALGRVYCGWTDTKELDLRAFKRRRPKGNRLYRIIRPVLPRHFRRRLKELLPDKESREVESRRSLLPPSTLSWVDNVIADARYKQIHGARNQFTHAWISRRLFRGGAPGHSGRTQFAIRHSTATPNARTLVELARDLATDHVIAFFAVVDSL